MRLHQSTTSSSLGLVILPHHRQSLPLTFSDRSDRMRTLWVIDSNLEGVDHANVDESEYSVLRGRRCCTLIVTTTTEGTLAHFHVRAVH